MADVYLWSGATGTGTGATWANAFTTLSAAIAGRSAGDTVWMANDHSESTSAAVSLSMPQAINVICVNRTGGSVPPSIPTDLAYTGVVATGAGAFNITITGANNLGSVYMCGVNFVAGSGTSSASILFTGTGIEQVFENCVFRLRGTNSASSISIGTA